MQQQKIGFQVGMPPQRNDVTAHGDTADLLQATVTTINVS